MTYAFFPGKGIRLVTNIDRHPLHHYFRVHCASHGETHSRLGEWVHLDDVSFVKDSEVPQALEICRRERRRAGLGCTGDCWCNNG